MRLENQNQKQLVAKTYFLQQIVLSPIFRGLGWPCILMFEGFITIFFFHVFLPNSYLTKVGTSQSPHSCYLDLMWGRFCCGTAVQGLTKLRRRYCEDSDIFCEVPVCFWIDLAHPFSVNARRGCFPPPHPLLHLERGAWSMVQRLRQATNDHLPPHPPARTLPAGTGPSHSQRELPGGRGNEWPFHPRGPYNLTRRLRSCLCLLDVFVLRVWAGFSLCSLPTCCIFCHAHASLGSCILFQ